MGILRIIGGKDIKSPSKGLLSFPTYLEHTFSKGEIFEVRVEYFEDGIEWVSDLEIGVAIPREWTEDVKVKFVGGDPITGGSILLTDTNWCLNKGETYIAKEISFEDKGSIRCYKMDSGRWAPCVWFQDAVDACMCSSRDLLTWGHLPQCGRKAKIDKR